jgi:hypothetical protein
MTSTLLSRRVFLEKGLCTAALTLLRPDLVHSLGEKITTYAEWKRDRENTLRGWVKMLGGDPRTEPQRRVSANGFVRMSIEKDSTTIVNNDVKRTMITFMGPDATPTFSDPIKAILLEPVTAKPNGAGMVCLHQSTNFANRGMFEPAGFGESCTSAYRSNGWCSTHM